MGSAYKYHKTIYNEELKKSKTISALSWLDLKMKIDLQEQHWADEIDRKRRVEATRLAASLRKQETLIAKQQKREELFALDNEARRRTINAEKVQKDLENLLKNQSVLKPFSFNSLKKRNSFDIKEPEEPTYKPLLIEPKRDEEFFNPPIDFWTKHSAKKMNAYIQENDKKFLSVHNDWEIKNKRITEENEDILANYSRLCKEWEKKRKAFFDNQKAFNAGIDSFKDSVEHCDVEAVSELIEIVLNRIEFPFEFITSYEYEYYPENKTLVLDATFPIKEDIPALKNVTYIKSKGEYKETYYSESQIKKKYDATIYSLVLLYFNHLFNLNKTADLFDGIVLNGIVNTIDRTTGNEMSACILTVRVSRDDFEKLNLTEIDPKAWFRSSKGIAAADITIVTPVRPIQTLSREDKRFVEGYEVLADIEEGDNLAAMDWQDFENLIRELFAEVFNGENNEVKITQASRDGGVDAVVFISNGLMSGKILVQAKRYTNVVGVGAVRDLSGAVHNERAMKGILVTTSYFGNDAYDFAKDNNIELIDGARLLDMLAEYGHKARIDLQEAKIINNESK